MTKDIKEITKQVIEESDETLRGLEEYDRGEASGVDVIKLLRKVAENVRERERKRIREAVEDMRREVTDIEKNPDEWQKDKQFNKALNDVLELLNDKNSLDS